MLWKHVFMEALCVSIMLMSIIAIFLKLFPQIPRTSTWSKAFCHLHIVSLPGSFFIALSGSYHTLRRSPPPPSLSVATVWCVVSK